MGLGDAALRAFMAQHGFADPMYGRRPERKIWQDGNPRIRRRDICSASSATMKGQVTMTVLQVLTAIYPEYLPLPLPPDHTPEQRQDWLVSEADRLATAIFDLSHEMAEAAIQDWIRRHGQHPDYLTKVGLVNTARLSAQEIVLRNEIYEQIPEEQDEDSLGEDLLGIGHLDAEPLSRPDPTGVPWQQRWTDPDYRTDPSEELEAQVARIWPQPQFSTMFQILAGYLLASRTEDGEPIPTSSRDPLAAQLAPLIEADLASLRPRR